MFMKTIEKDGEVEVALDGEIMMPQVAEFYGVLNAALMGGKSVIVDASGVVQIHSAVMQVLWSAQRSSERMGIRDPSKAFSEMEIKMGVILQKRS